MTTFIPETHPNFTLQFELKTIIRAPANNTKTYNDIIAEHLIQQRKPVLRKLNKSQIEKELRDEFKNKNNIEEIP